MTNPVFFADSQDLSGLDAGDVFELGGAEGHHAATVKRIAAGEPVDLVDGSGLRLVCSVVQSGAGMLLLQIDRRIEEPQPAPRLVLVQALAKDGRDELAIETATELGVDAVIPWQADRSIVRWRPERLEKSMAKWQKTIQAAAKQARRARIPELHGLLDSAGLVRHAAAAEATRLVVLHEDAAAGLATQLADWHEARQLLLVVGPEGGMSDRELALFDAAGADRWRLGQHVLRSSTAGPAALAVLGEALARW
ncbi:MAG: 16S rRNA (uracil(1498)-N(3))-methyltransferase [Renibacterium sp.]|nr:16S rRNA (uracil(1498)-N(3))-methyltransferase [Renibacterium sp.]